MKISMTIFGSMELAIKTMLRVATVMTQVATQVAAEVRGTMKSLLMAPMHNQRARPWLNGTVVIEQGPWLVNFGKLVSNIGMSGEQVDEILTYIRDWGSQTQEYLAENSSRGVTTWIK
jgi:hypothetical protein